MPLLLTVTEAARRLKIHHSNVSRQARAWGLVDGAGKLDFDAYVELRGENLDPGQVERHAAGRAEPAESAAAITGEHHRLRAELLRLELHERQGLLIERAVVEEAATTAARMLRDGLLALPARLAQELAGVSDVTEIRRIIDARLRELLAEFDAALTRITAGETVVDEVDAAA